MTDETAIRFRSGDIELDGRATAAAGAGRGCVVCHPHPLYGGDMHNPVVVAISRALARDGVATLRFDFRGVGASGGVHGGGEPEIDDAGAAVDKLASLTGLPRIVLCGYSFGAWIALQLAAADARVAAVAAVAPPIAMPGVALAHTMNAPLLVIAGDRDTYCPARDAESLVAGRDRSKAMILRGADHFLAGREDEVGRMVAGFVAGI